MLRQTASAFAEDAFGNALASKVIAWASEPPKSPATPPTPKGGIDNIASSLDPRRAGLIAGADLDLNLGSDADLNSPPASVPDSSSTSAQTPEREIYTVRSGDTISDILGTSNPKAVEAFMRANGLSSSKIIAGREYNLPSDADYAESSGAAGQKVLNSDNARIAAIASAKNAEAEAIASSGSSFGPYKDEYRFAQAASGQPSSTPASGQSPTDTDNSVILGLTKGDISDRAKDVAAEAKALYARSKGFIVQELANGNVRILGSHAANEILDLPRNFRISGAANSQLLAAMGGYSDNIAGGIKNAVSDLKPTKVSGALAAVGTGAEIYDAYSTFKKDHNDANFAGASGNAVVKLGVTTVATGLAMAAITVGAGAATIATAPIWLTVGAAAAVGYGISKVYDYAVAPTVTKGITNAYKKL